MDFVWSFLRRKMKALSRVPCNNSDPDCFLKTAIKEGPPAVSTAEYKTLRPICFNCARSCPEYCIYFHTTLFMHDEQIRSSNNDTDVLSASAFSSLFARSIKGPFSSPQLLNCVFNYRKMYYMQTTST